MRTRQHQVSQPGCTIMIDRSKFEFGEPLPGYRFKPGECVVNSHHAEELREGNWTPKEFDWVKMVVLEVGVNTLTRIESYHLIGDSPAKGGIPWEQADVWHTKEFVESNFELCDYPAI